MMMINGNTKRLYDTVNYSKSYYHNRYGKRCILCCRYWGVSRLDMYALHLLMRLSGRYDKVEYKEASFGYCIYATKSLINTDTILYKDER